MLFGAVLTPSRPELSAIRCAIIAILRGRSETCQPYHPVTRPADWAILYLDHLVCWHCRLNAAGPGMKCTRPE